jgi:hypothetical protein
MSRHALRTLPDSSGKQISLKHHYEVSYNSAASLDAFSKGDVITGQTSNVNGVILKVITESISEGTLYIRLDQANEESSFINGENLIVNNSIKGKIASFQDVYSQKINLISWDNPYQGQIIDNIGSAYFRFPDGPMSLDGYARARVNGNPTLIGKYGDNNYFLDTSLVYLSFSVGSSVSYNTINLAKEMINSTGSNDGVSFFTNYYHKYIPGQSQLIEGTVNIGSLNSENVTYRWGYFDHENGFFFQYKDNVLSIGIKNNSSGNVVETIIEQDDWSHDRLDGSFDSRNLSGLSIDITKIQQYWIDLQWPTGQIRFGIFYRGQRILCHSFSNFNLSSNPVTRTATLPVGATINNNSSGSATVSQLNIYDARVWTEGNFTNIIDSAQTYQVISQKAITNTEIPIALIQPKETIFGRNNRSIAILSKINTYLFSGSSPEAVKIKIYGNIIPIIPSGSTFNAFSSVFSGFEVDTDLTSFAGGLNLGETYFYGVEERNVQDVTSPYGIKNIGNNFDLSKRSILITAQTVKSGSIIDNGIIAFSWKEILD